MITIKELTEEIPKCLALRTDQEEPVPEEIKLFWLHKNKDTGLVTGCSVVINIKEMQSFTPE